MATRNPQDDDATWSPWRDPFLLVWIVTLIVATIGMVAVRTWMTMISVD